MVGSSKASRCRACPETGNADRDGARSSPVPGLRVDAAAAQAVQSAKRTARDGNAGRVRTFQGSLLTKSGRGRGARSKGCVSVHMGLLRNRSQAQKAAGVKPALLPPFVRMHPQTRLRSNPRTRLRSNRPLSKSEVNGSRLVSNCISPSRDPQGRCSCAAPSCFSFCCHVHCRCRAQQAPPRFLFMARSTRSTTECAPSRLPHPPMVLSRPPAIYQAYGIQGNRPNSDSLATTQEARW